MLQTPQNSLLFLTKTRLQPYHTSLFLTETGYLNKLASNSFSCKKTKAVSCPTGHDDSIRASRRLKSCRPAGRHSFCSSLLFKQPDKVERANNLPSSSTNLANKVPSVGLLLLKHYTQLKWIHQQKRPERCFAAVGPFGVGSYFGLVFCV